jgi:ribosomal protein L11 methyltransferase
MSWLEVSVQVSKEKAPLVEQLLENQSVLALTLTDSADDPVLEPGVGETPLWPSVCITALFGADQPREPLSRLLSLVPGIDRPQQVSFRKVEDQQWERAWLDRFKPMQFGRDLWIVPGNLEAPATAGHVLRLDPGLAFGTGTHPTTRLCLQWIDGHDFKDRLMVDFGCGSGVLGIAAAIKGATRVIAVDNDPQALLATRDNADRNHVTDKINAVLPDQFRPAQADIILANILAGPLIDLSADLLKALRPGGSLVLSGVLEEQADEVIAAYQPYTDPLLVTKDDGWVCISGRKLSPASSNREAI